MLNKHETLNFYCFRNLILTKSPIDLQTRIRDGFSKRLIYILKKRGHTSTKAHSGVSAKAVSEALGCSFTMARKYLAGQSLPENKTMEVLSNWLNVDVWWLLYGDKDSPAITTIDKGLLADILKASKHVLIQHQQNWDHIVDSILKIYDSISELEGTKENKKNSIQLMLDFLFKSLSTSN